MVNAKWNEDSINHITGDINFAGLLLKKSRTILSILDCSDAESKLGIRGWLLRVIWYRLPVRRAAIITTISEASRDAITRITGCDAGRIKVIPVAVSSIYQYRPKSGISDCPRILQVGASPNKNLERVVEALQGISCRLTVIGKLDSKQQTLLDNAKLSYENHVGLTTEQLFEQYVNSDLVVFASLFEGFGMPIVEAQSVGRPVVTSNVTSMPEVAGDGACLVDPLNVESIRGGILRIIENSDYREKLVDAGRKNAARFNGSEIAQQYYKLYKQISAQS